MRAVLAVLLGIFVWGAVTLPTAAGVDLSGTPLFLGAVRVAGPPVTRSLELMAGYLARGLRRPVEVRSFDQYDQVIDALRLRRVQLAVLPPVVFLMAREQGSVKPIATPVYQSGETSYRSVILVPQKRRDLAQLMDLKGKKVAFVDRHSASGYVVPRALLRQAGLGGATELEEVFTGNHVKSLEALISGKVDAAATYDMLLAQTPSLGKTLEDFTVLARSEPIPAEVLVGAEGLPEKDAARFRELLLAFGKKRETEPRYADCLYQSFSEYKAVRFEALDRLLKAERGPAR